MRELSDLLFAKSLFSGDAVLRAQVNSTRRVVVRNGVITANASSASGGVNARVYRGGVYGFASAAGFSDEDIKNVISAAEENARFLDSRLSYGRPPLPAVGRFDGLDRPAEDPTTQKQLVDYALALDAHIAQSYPDLLSRTVVITGLNMEKCVVASEGCDFHSFVPRVYVYVFLTVEKDGEPFELFDCFGGGGTFGELYSDPADHAPAIDRLYRNVKAKSEGVFADAGVKTVILAPELSGMLAHEAVGHTSEGDFVLSGSVSAHNKGKEVASDLVTMIDYAHHIGDRRCPMPVYVDDEGTPAEDAVLIDRGILKDYMHSRETALRLGCRPTGNARGFAYSDEPLVRMRNTVILPGKDKLADMIASVEDEYYLLSTSNGQADSTGEFTFGISMGYEIKKGRLGRAIKNTSISGVAFEMLKTVDMVSDDLYLESNGMCGKKQQIPVGLGGPALRCRVAVGGR
ncbi:MAG: TldD/PmbA family protein [Clostridia bacterium]|nr:TldD/PmbA family protein [Clostridia bacterium]